jgi:hypothetical protein
VAVPLLLLLPTAAMAAAAAAVGRWSGASATAVAVAVAAAALLLGGGALAAHPAGMVPVAAAFALLQVAMVLTDARLQDAIRGPARATVTSVAGLGAEVFALSLFAAYAAGSAWWGAPVLVAVCAVPLLGLAAVIRRWLPAPASPRVHRGRSRP